jgi:DNA-binding transcriptional LysR family regulator
VPRLFRRTKRWVELTPAGHAFLIGCRRFTWQSPTHPPDNRRRSAPCDGGVRPRWARRDGCFPRRGLCTLRRAWFTPRVAYGVPDVQAAIALVAAGLRISPVPAAIQGFWRKGVVYRPLRPHTLRIEMGLAWRRDDSALFSSSGALRVRRRDAPSIHGARHAEHGRPYRIGPVGPGAPPWQSSTSAACRKGCPPLYPGITQTVAF